jgi:hypothetical protein
MAAPVLYTALTNLEVRNMSASWPCPAGNVLPLDPANPGTVRLLANGSIVVAPGGAVDNTTPTLMVRGVPGIRVAVSN